MQLEAARSAAPAENKPTPAQRGRPWVWPALVLVGLYWAYYFGRPYLELVTPVVFFSWVGTSFLFPLLFLGWWLTRRGIPLRQRLTALLVTVACGTAASWLSHPSLHGDPGPGGWFFRILNALTFGIPVVFTAWSVWLLLSKWASPAVQQGGLLLVIVLGWVPFTLIQLEDVTGDLHARVSLRGTPKAEDIFLAERNTSANATKEDARPLSLSAGDWPGFRGPQRNSVFSAGPIATDWKSHPPQKVWEHRVGPGWSSVAVVGDRIFTQEQWRDREVTVCYDAASGEQVWAHPEPARFQESVSGAGPRATPTFADGRLYTLGATGLLTCLDAASGRHRWTQDTMADAEATPMRWGMSSSPLVVEGRVVVFAGGDKGKSLLAYHADSGKLAWTAEAGKDSYSSPQLATLDGKSQVLFFGQGGLSSFEPATGTLLWKHELGGSNAMPALQPQVVGRSQVLVGLELDVGLALLEVHHENGSWKVSEQWRSKAMKPAFNDFVVYKGHIYGFDQSIFCCVDLQTGERRWKNGRYGKGQVLLLQEQGLLLVVTELDEKVVLLSANPEKHEERGRFKSIEGKTWNHPVIAHGRLFLRNAEWMACYDVRPSEPTLTLNDKR